jgi:hypothetical protein
VLAAVPDPKRDGAGWRARCPSHEDRRASLGIREAEDGRVLMRCRAGCKTEAVVAALGLTWAALYPDRPADTGRGAQPAANGHPATAGRTVRHELRSLDGQVVAVHCREVDPATGKKLGAVWWERPDGSRGLGGSRVEDLPMFVPGSAATLAALKDGAEVILTEGEPAAVAVAWCGLAAAGTVTGAATIPSYDVLRSLVRLRVQLWPDHDEPGREHMARIAGRLAALGCGSVEVIEWPEAPARGDARDFLLPHVKDAAAGRVAVEALPRRPWSPPGRELVTAHIALSAPPTETWPELDGAALHGLAGEVVEAIGPHTEADPVAVLVSLLVAFGNAAGTGPHVVVGATHHPARIFAALVGETSRARKGDSWAAVRRLMAQAVPEWAEARVQGGLSSGEGLISAVRDPVEEIDRKTGERRVVDAGAEDRRLLAVEPELSRTLRVMKRDGSTLSAVIRDAWDSGSLRVMTKTQLRATGAHISVIGHITEEELRRELDDVSLANGFANRFLWLAVRRSKRLPEPEPLDGPAVDRLSARIAEALRFARACGAVLRDDDARQVWAEVYPDLTADRPGMLGAILSRSEAHAVRLSLIYALLDQSSVVRREHLHAALAVIDYAEASTRHIFGDRLGDPVADAIVAALADGRELTRNALRDLFGHHGGSQRIAAALVDLAARGLVTAETRETGGRPAEVWRRVP